MTRAIFVLLFASAAAAQPFALAPGAAVRASPSATPPVADLGFYAGPVVRCAVAHYMTGSPAPGLADQGIGTWVTTMHNPGVIPDGGFVMRVRRQELRTLASVNSYATSTMTNERPYTVTPTAGDFAVWWRWGAPSLTGTQKAHVGLFSSPVINCVSPSMTTGAEVHFECAAGANLQLCSGLTGATATCMTVSGDFACAGALFDSVLSYTDGDSTLGYYVKNLDTGAEARGTTGALYTPDAGLFLMNYGAVCNFGTATVAALMVVETCSFSDW